MMATSGGTNNYAYFGGSDFVDEWYTLRIEMYRTNGKWIAQYFYDDVFIFEDLSGRLNDSTPISYLEIVHTSRNFTFYLDNITFERTDKTYSATPKNAAPTLTGTTGTGVYYSASSKNTTSYKVIDFNLDFTDNGNGRYNDDDTAPRVTNYKQSIDGYNANGYGLLVKETAKNHASIKYSTPTPPKDSEKAYKSIIEMDLAISEPFMSTPIVISTIFCEAAGDIYIGYDATKNQCYVTDFSSKVAYFNLDEWHNFRFEITYEFVTNESGAITGAKSNIDVYFDGEYAGAVKGLDSKYRKGYSNQMNIQLRQNAETVKFSYDNLVLTYAEVTE
jgi:hypothetical protein